MAVGGRHVYLQMTMTQDQFKQYLTTLSLAPESCPFPRELAAKLYEEQESQPKDLLLQIEWETPEVIEARTECDIEGCRNKIHMESNDELCEQHLRSEWPDHWWVQEQAE